MALSQSSTPHSLQIPADSLWPSSAYKWEGFFFFHSLWHFQTDTTQGWQCSGWALSLGRSAGPRPPRAASLNLESCCWYRSRHGSSVPGTSLPTRSPREDPEGKELSDAMENRGCVMCLGLLCASPNLWMLLAPEKASQEGREKPATNVWQATDNIATSLQRWTPRGPLMPYGQAQKP